MSIRIVSSKAEPRRSGGRTKRRSGDTHNNVCNRFVHNIPGTKLVKRFVNRASGEAYSYRLTLAHMLDYIDIR